MKQNSNHTLYDNRTDNGIPIIFCRRRTRHQITRQQTSFLTMGCSSSKAADLDPVRSSFLFLRRTPLDII
jgi:hypothetical protein